MHEDDDEDEMTRKWFMHHVGMRDHLKTKMLARRLGGDPFADVRVTDLVELACVSAPDGDLSKFSAEALHVAAREPPCTPEEFVAHLKACGWLTADMKLHEWEEYHGAYEETRQKEAEKKRRQRARTSEAAVDGADVPSVPGDKRDKPAVEGDMSPRVPRDTSLILDLSSSSESALTSNTEETSLHAARAPATPTRTAAEPATLRADGSWSLPPRLQRRDLIHEQAVRAAEPQTIAEMLATEHPFDADKRTIGEVWKVKFGAALDGKGGRPDLLAAVSQPFAYWKDHDANDPAARRRWVWPRTVVTGCEDWLLGTIKKATEAKAAAERQAKFSGDVATTTVPRDAKSAEAVRSERERFDAWCIHLSKQGKPHPLLSEWRAAGEPAPPVSRESQQAPSGEGDAIREGLARMAGTMRVAGAPARSGGRASADPRAQVARLTEALAKAKTPDEREQLAALLAKTKQQASGGAR